MCQPIKKGDTIFSASVTDGKVTERRYDVVRATSKTFHVSVSVRYPHYARIVNRKRFDAGKEVDNTDHHYARTPAAALAYLTDALAAKRVALTNQLWVVKRDELAVVKLAREDG